MKITKLQFSYRKKLWGIIPASWVWFMKYTTEFYPLGQSSNWGVHWTPRSMVHKKVKFEIVCTPPYGRTVTASKTYDIYKNARGLSVHYRGFPNNIKYVGDFTFKVSIYEDDILLDVKTFVVPGKRKADYE
jgi:hypothetical protein